MYFSLVTCSFAVDLQLSCDHRANDPGMTAGCGDAALTAKADGRQICRDGQITFGCKTTRDLKSCKDNLFETLACQDPNIPHA